MAPKVTDRFMGLNGWALERITSPGAKTALTDAVYADTQGSKHPLFQYTITDGTIYVEDLQTYLSLDAERKIYFLALLDGAGKWVPESIWSDEEIKDACRICLEYLTEDSIADAPDAAASAEIGEAAPVKPMSDELAEVVEVIGVDPV